MVLPTSNISLSEIKYVYFIGIGGIGMSAIARWFHFNNHQVAGYDKTSTPLTKELEKKGINIHYQDEVDQIPKDFRSYPDETLVIFTPAIPESHKELLFFERNGYQIMKRAAVLGMLTKNIPTIAVAGTHGKTTTSTMVAHVLQEGGINCTAFLGGISANFNSNLLLNDPKNEQALWAVVEADEFDRSFLHLHPKISIITSTDADHLDIYGDKSFLEESFGDFISQLQTNGVLYAQNHISNEVKRRLPNDSTLREYASETKSPIRAENIIPTQNACRFDYVNDYDKKKISNLELSMPGFHNVENMTAAISVALQLGVSEEDIKRAVASFKGIKRRFEYIFKGQKVIYIDDYAHHPTEINALLQSVKHLYPNKKVITVFQPHLYSRTRDFEDGFAESLSLSDELILLDIYPAREQPIAGVSSKNILQKSTAQHKILLPDPELLSYLKEKVKNERIEVLLTVGAGDIDRFVARIGDMLKEQTV